MTTPARQVTFGAGYSFGNAVNFFPATGVTAPCSQPCLARSDAGDAELTLRPVAALRIDNQYLFTRQRALEASTAIFNNHIARSSWNWQLSRELSVCVILQYNSMLANPFYASQPTSKNFNGDILFTYLLHPGTAIYVSYNSDFQNAEIDPATHLIRFDEPTSQ